MKLRSLVCVLSMALIVVPTGTALAAEGGAASPASAKPSSYREYASLLLGKHPGIKSMESAVDAARNVPERDGSLSDPKISFGVMNLPAESLSMDMMDMTMKQFSVSQDFPTPGKRSLRREIAEKNLTIKELALAETRNDLLQNVWVLFLRLRYLEKAEEAVRSNRDALDGFAKVVLSKYSVGSGMQQDVLRAQTEVSRMDVYLSRIEEEIGIVRAKLALLAGLPAGTDLSSIVPPEPNPSGTTLDELEKLAIERRPRFKAKRLEIEKVERRVELSRLDYYPDYAVELSYGQRDPSPDGMDREDMVSAMVMMKVPLWKNSRQDRKLAEDIELLEMARQNYESEKQTLRIKLAELLETEEKKVKTMDLYDSGLIVQASQTVKATFSAYQVNKADFLSLVMSQIMLFDQTVARDMVEYELQAARVKIIRTAGGDFPEVADVR